MATKSEIESLKTKEQKFKDVKYDRMFVSKKQIISEAFLSLKTAAACQVYMIFRTKCRYEKVQKLVGCRDMAWAITNNGKIQFSYKEAFEKYDINPGKFKRAIEELLRVGLIDIKKSGFGLRKDVTLYAISNRWEKFGNNDFVVKTRHKRTQQLGFAKKNSYGKNSNKRKNQRSSITVEQQLPITVETGQEETQCSILG